MPTFSRAKNSFFGKAKACFMKLAGIFLRSERLSGVEKCLAEGVLPADLRRVREIVNINF